MLCLAHFAAVKCEAATLIWDGGGTNAFWDTVLNWDTDALPANGDTVQFSSGLGSGSTINLNGNRTAQKLIISTLSSFSITNSTLTLNSGDITRSDIVGTEADHTITSGIALGADGAWIIAGSGSLFLSGVVSGAKKATKSGAGTLVLTGNNTFSDEFSVTAGTVAFGHDSAAGTGNLKMGTATFQA